MLGSILACFSSYSCDCLFELCKLGDEISPKLNELFASKQTPQSIKVKVISIYFFSIIKLKQLYILKEIICKIFQIQIYLHRKASNNSDIDFSTWNVSISYLSSCTENI